jgi:YVTN family beta-propeller protein
MRWRFLAATLALISAYVSLAAAGSPTAQEPRATGLPSGWSLTPAGRLITIPRTRVGLPGPWGLALSPGGRSALVTSSGAAVQNETTELFDLATGRRTSLRVYNGNRGASAFYGVTFAPDGRHAWASGGGQGIVHSYSVSPTGQLLPAGDIPAGFFPAGIAFGHTPIGDRLYVANNLGGPVNPSVTYADPPGHTVSVIDPAAGKLTATIDLGAALDPLAVAFNREGTRAYVSNWAGRSVSVIDTTAQQKIADIPLSPQDNPMLADHPTGIAANPRIDELYTANANSDTVSVIDTVTNKVVSTINVALAPGSPKGSTPVGLTVSPDGRTLYVADAGENALAVVDLIHRTVRGFIPTAWYPADVRATPDGRQLVVINTYGFGAGPNPCGPFSSLGPVSCPIHERVFPGTYYTPPLSETQYIGSMIKGSVEVIDLPRSDSALTQRLARWTAQVRQNNHVELGMGAAPSWLHAIKHVIYVIKENRSYDQVFGSLGKGNGDPALTLFNDSSAPNHRELARRFVLLDNFYVDAQVSQDGHPWTVQGVATDYVNKTWPFDYAAIYSRSYDSEFVPLEQQFTSEPLASDPSIPRPVATATAGYLWDNAFSHGVSFRDYGEGTPFNDPTNCHSGKVFSSLTHLQARFGNHVDARYPGWNLDCSDHAVREPEWQREFRQFVRHRNLPGLSIVYFPNDHTQGTTPGTATPASYVADNDLALGRLVQAVSHSPYWRSTAIFVIEDDAQDGPDHVDAHRSVALVISPYTQRAAVDSTHYDTAAMLATMEQLLGLPPMSIYDRRALPMWNAFAASPNMQPYSAIEPSVIPYGDPRHPRNTAHSPMAAWSARQNYSVPDGPNADALNRAIWQSIHGTPIPSRG